MGGVSSLDNIKRVLNNSYIEVKNIFSKNDWILKYLLPIFKENQ